MDDVVRWRPLHIYHLRELKLVYPQDIAIYRYSQG